ncbi:MAG: protein-L-isoaspartate(D-aspartate) O-methyltransferase [Burkholderiales bacterium]|nr:protein-L-isoaspartate(D-aspartate) O-methyltransferase [Burkholderiales bacterium]
MSVVASKFTGSGMTSDRTRARMVEALRSKGVKVERVLTVMGEVPRHVFVEEALQERAYEVDKALPIGHGQTISTPEIVAIMSSLLCEGALGIPKKVLEIGTGCGYQTAVLAKLSKEVYTVERIAPLMDRARRTLRDLRYFNIIFKHADGHFGYAGGGPYDGIIMTAAATRVPEELKQQLVVGGRLVLPVGKESESQKLTVIDRTAEGYTEKVVHDVRFVPLVPGIL